MGIREERPGRVGRVTYAATRGPAFHLLSTPVPACPPARYPHSGLRVIAPPFNPRRPRREGGNRNTAPPSLWFFLPGFNSRIISKTFLKRFRKLFPGFFRKRFRKRFRKLFQKRFRKRFRKRFHKVFQKIHRHEALRDKCIIHSFSFLRGSRRGSPFFLLYRNTARAGDVLWFSPFPHPGILSGPCGSSGILRVSGRSFPSFPARASNTVPDAPDGIHRELVPELLPGKNRETFQDIV